MIQPGVNKERELLDGFVRVTHYPDVIVIFVGDIAWSGHQPETTWVPLIALPVNTSPQEVDKRAASVLQRKRYFSVCRECSELNPRGWMHTATQCQLCFEKAGGVF